MNVLTKMLKMTMPLLAVVFFMSCDTSERDYKKIMSSDIKSVSDCREFLEKHPTSPHVDEIRDTAAAQIIDTYSIDYIQRRDYYFGNDDGVYHSILKLLGDEDYVWKLALKKDRIDYYELYLERFPQGQHFHQIELMLIDKEVEETFSGEHGIMPPLEKGRHTGKSYSTISLENKTQYELTISYKGPDRKRVVIAPYGRTKIDIGNGHYQVAARVKTSNVLPYAGEENLDGSNFSSSYYIETRGGGFNPSRTFDPDFKL